MTSNPEPIVQQLQGEFQNLLADVTGPGAGSQTIYTLELPLFRRRLALGKALLQLFLVRRAAVRPAEPVTAPDGTRLTAHDQRPTTDESVVGQVRFARQYFTAPGQEGCCPLDAELSLPVRCYSALLREWAVYGAPDASYRESQTVLARILGLSLSLQAIESAVLEAGGDVTTFYEQPAEPTAPSPAATILVVQADGQGVPADQAEGSRGYESLYHEPLGAHPPGGGRRPAAGDLGGEGGRHEPAGAAGGPARWAPHPAARGAHGWR